jgi:hypothetical protein
VRDLARVVRSEYFADELDGVPRAADVEEAQVEVKKMPARISHTTISGSSAPARARPEHDRRDDLGHGLDGVRDALVERPGLRVRREEPCPGHGTTVTGTGCSDQLARQRAEHPAS